MENGRAAIIASAARDRIVPDNLSSVLIDGSPKGDNAVPSLNFQGQPAAQDEAPL